VEFYVMMADLDFFFIKLSEHIPFLIPLQVC
jgi:hypothetical protein